LPFRISNGMFMPVNGVSISENNITCTDPENTELPP